MVRVFRPTTANAPEIARRWSKQRLMGKGRQHGTSWHGRNEATDRHKYPHRADLICPYMGLREQMDSAARPVNSRKNK